MAKVDVLNWKKEKVGSVELDASVFEVEVKKEFLHTVVNWQLASRRQGTHMTKTKGLVSGG
nr:50S ribosomal protein L4 [Pseudobdellovibrionaceae bacterium]